MAVVALLLCSYLCYKYWYVGDSHGATDAFLPFSVPKTCMDSLAAVAVRSSRSDFSLSAPNMRQRKTGRWTKR